IVAAILEVGDSSRTPIIANLGTVDNGGGTSTLFLGAGTNVINIGIIFVGNTKGAGVINWVDALNGLVTIAGQAGGSSRANINVGRHSAGSSTSLSSQMLLAGHTANVLADVVQVGILQATGSAPADLITFD